MSSKKVFVIGMLGAIVGFMVMTGMSFLFQDVFTVDRNGTVDFRVSTTGNVGIGSGSDNPQSRLVIRSSGTGTTTSALDVQASNGTSRFYVRDDGNVGIGTMGPGANLSVAGTLGISETGSAGNRLQITTSGAGAVIFQNDNSPIIFKTFSGTQEKMRITDGGYVGIGTAGPIQKLHVLNNVSTGYAARFQHEGNNADRRGIQIDAGENDGNNPSATIFADFLSGDGLIRLGNITAVSGAVQVAYNTTSDRRIKMNVVDTRFGLDDLMRIKVRDYQFINNTDGSIHPGFIAQELVDIYPEAVSVPDNPDDLWSVDYGKVTPLVVTSVQELSRTVEKQQKQIEILQQKITELEAKTR